MPDPSVERARVPAMRWNRSNSRGSSSAGIPAPGVGDGQLDRAVAVGAQGDRDVAVQGELQRVGQQVEDDLLPGLPVDVDRPGQRRAVHRVVQPGALHRRPEQAAQLGGEGGEVGGLERRAQPSGLQPGEVEQRGDEPSEAQRVAVHDVELRGEPARLRRGVAQLLDRSHDQGQGRAELVADVREEVGLGAVELGERLRTLTLGLVGARGDQRGLDLPRQEVDEGPVALVEQPERVQPDDQCSPDEGLALRPGERDEHGVRRWPVPGAAGQLRQVGGEVVDDGRAALAHRGERPARRVGHGRVRCDARGADQRGPAVLGELVDQRERQVLRVAGQRPPGRGVHLRPGPGRPQVGGEVAQRLHAAFAEHAVGVLGDHAEHPRDRAVLVQRAVGEGVVGLLEVAAAFEEQQEVLAPGGPSAGEHRRDHRADVVPDLGPHLAGGAAERPRVLVAQRVAPVGVVVEHREVRAPRHPHREPGVEQHPDDAAQLGRPPLGRAERVRRPVVCCHGGVDQVRRRTRACGSAVRAGWAVGPRRTRARNARVVVASHVPLSPPRRSSTKSSRRRAGAPGPRARPNASSGAPTAGPGTLTPGEGRRRRSVRPRARGSGPRLGRPIAGCRRGAGPRCRTRRGHGRTRGAGPR